VVQLKQIGQNSTEDFFETLTYMAAYDKATKQLEGFVKGIDDPYLKEAVESAANVAVFGGIFMIIQYEQQIIEKVFSLSSVLISGLLSFPRRGINRLRNLRGRRLGIISRILSSFSNDGVGTAQVVTNQVNNYIQGRNNQYQSMNLIEGTQQIRGNVVNRENVSLNLANNMASRYSDTLLFRLLTSSFTENDREILRRILGRNSVSNLDVDDLNRIGEFIYARDGEGHIVGLSEAFLSLVNGLGYVR
jgi:hypothetical protein